MINKFVFGIAATVALLMIGLIIGQDKSEREIPFLQNQLDSIIKARGIFPVGFTWSDQYEYELTLSATKFETKIIDKNGKELAGILYLAQNGKITNRYYIDYSDGNKLKNF
jgi:hypothetical protein